jgi:hypothetical protein
VESPKKVKEIINDAGTIFSSLKNVNEVILWDQELDRTPRLLTLIKCVINFESK